ncbi:hypothetical protein MFLAVUS_003392 [Mucor flavus]|uniref:Uncharacterized protein n=1 Tax=Mucor flavus TaxID=439312 RepID=A0ABP9YT31_9FUNG
MKSTVALTLLATIALHQVAYAQEEVNIATAPAVPTLPAAVTDIYWWKTLLTGDEISNYLTGPATEAATATQATTDAQETNSADTTTAAVTEATPTGQESLSAAATATDSAISSVNSNLASAISDASSAISDILSTSAAVSDSIATSSGVPSPSAVAWTSSSASYAAPTVVAKPPSSSVILPRPSGSIIPPSTTSNTVGANSGSTVMASKVLFSFLAIASGLMAVFGVVSAQLTSPMQNYNVSSPVSNGPYVMGQILPCTIQLFENVMSDIQLSISLESAVSTNATVIIAASVDVSKTTASAKSNGNVTYYEHSVNYKIPTTLVPGVYKVVFMDSRTNTHLDVPINVLPVASASVINSPTNTGSSSSSPTSSGSIFKGEAGNGVAAMSPGLTTKALLSLACVAGFALML